ncbi:MAG: gluconate 2-dehydrogenase subunit 3 family protein [Spirosomaceae bacterium]|nr:gluconate 2-dehydrogenase subunit 3 family protein [Spirosomataceae bacterium]
MNRRNALQRVAIMMGGAISAPTMVAMLQGCSTEGETATGFSFSADYKKLVAEIAEVIIPKTDTPGAKEAGVGPFIETMLSDCYTEMQQKHFITGLDAVAAKAKTAGGDFESLTAEQKTDILKAMEADAKSEMDQQKGEAAAKIRDSETGLEKAVDKGTEVEVPVPFFNLMKELTLFGYFTSEVGCKEALAYLPIPGRYEGCIPLEPGQKAWAL